MKLKEICSYLDSEVPLSFQEVYDNSGLQAGLPNQEITAAMITLDVTMDVIRECINEGCNLIVSHHPVIFHPLKRLAGATLAQKVIYQAIKNDIAVYSLHTNLDAASYGVSRKMASKLGLTNVRVLSPLKSRLMKLVTFVPEDHIEIVRNAVFEAGAGVIGNYDMCGYYISGSGSYRPGENTTPYAGEKGKLHIEKEVRFETILFEHQKVRVVNALLKSHPYEEVAYDLYPLGNDNINIGMGCIGEFAQPLNGRKFLELISIVFDAKGVRYSGIAEREVRTVGLCGGAGASLLGNAVDAGADAFITADVRYHNFVDAEDKILLVDCGHYETEKFAIEIISDLIIKKFPKFAVLFSKTFNNPVKYI
jgi:dinuclear metal center YbgI/SA1388 family protein